MIKHNTFFSRKVAAIVVLSLLTTTSLTGCPSGAGREAAEAAGRAAVRRGTNESAESAGRSALKQGQESAEGALRKGASNETSPLNPAVSEALSNELQLAEPPKYRQRVDDIEVSLTYIKQQNDRRKIHSIVSSCKTGVESDDMEELSFTEQVQIKENVKYICNQISQQIRQNSSEESR
jgi:hypothetical protein